MFPTFPVPNSVDPVNPADVMLLLHGEGVDGGTTIVDSSLYGRSPSGGSGTPTTSNTKAKFGDTSIWFRGYPEADYIYYGPSADFDLTLDENWTIECFANWITTENRDHIFQFGKDISNRFLVYINTTGEKSLVLGKITSAGNAFVTGPVPDVDQWYHICVMRKGASIYFFVGGVLYGTMSTDNMDLLSGDVRVDLGYQPYGTFYSANYFEGYLDEFRYIVGAAAYPETGFTPPIAPFPNPVI